MRTPTFKFILLILILVAVWGILGQHIHIDIESYRQRLTRYPLVLSGLIFVVLYVVSTTLVLVGPKDVLRIMSAILFGPYVSTVFVWFGEMGNLAVLFFLSRCLGREFVRKKLKLKYEDIAQAQSRAKRDSSFWWILALRVNPAVSFRFIDIGFGLSRVPFRKYFGISLFASIPRLFWIQFIIAGMGEAVFKGPSAMIPYLLENPSVTFASFFYLLAVVILTVIAIVVKVCKK